MPPVNLPEDGRWVLFFLSVDTAWGNWARGVFYWVSSVRCIYNHARFAERAGKKRERTILSSESSFIIVKRGKFEWSDSFLMFPRLEKTPVKAPRGHWARAPLVVNVSKHSSPILANLLRLPDGRSCPSRAYIAVSLIRNSSHVRCTSSYSRFSHAASYGHFFLPTISLKHLESCACRKRRSYTRNCPTIAQTGTLIVPENQVFPLTHHHRSPFHPFVSPEDWFELQIDAWKWLQLM